MLETVFTARQVREQRFYEEYSRRTTTLDVCFDPLTASQKRPWNSYWQLLDQVRQQFQTPTQKLLDFGCGSGEYAVLYGAIGYEVCGFDICPNNIALAQERARKYHLEERTHFAVGAAETLDYPADTFDVIVGVDILHHVDIAKALSECLRVLKKGGMAFFHEPVRVPVFDYLRETRLALAFAPKTVSYESHLTEDERKLDDRDLQLLKEADADYAAQRFLFTSRLRRLLPAGQLRLEKLDQRLFQRFPALQRFGGVMIAALHKKGSRE